MDAGTYAALSRATAVQRALAVGANNMANANTPGFKSERALFEAYLGGAGGDSETDVSLVLDRGSYLDPSAGSLRVTGNAFDVAIQGEGWFAFQTEDGRTALGRNGQLTKTADGLLVTARGHRLLDDGGAPVQLPAEATGISIARDGTISDSTGDTLGRVGVFRGDGIDGFDRASGAVFVPAGGAEPDLVPVLDPTVVQGALEGSNVDPVTEMTRLIKMQRAFEQANNAMGAEDQLVDETLRRLGRPA